MEDLRFRRQVDDCQPYVAGESEASVLRRYDLEKVVKLGSNENPFAPYPHEKEAMQESLNFLNRYPEDDYLELTKTIAKQNGVEPENVALGSGAGNVIETVSRLFLDEDDEAMIARPTYRLYREVSRLMGAKVIEVPVRDDFSYDFDAMKAAINEKTKLIWLCNPNNPTGAINDPAEIEEFIDEVGDNVWIVVDEAYADFIEDGMRPELVSRIEHKKVAIIRTFSKFYGLAGARVGYVLGLSLEFVPSHSNFIFAKLPDGFDADVVCEKMMSKGVIIRSCSAWGYRDCVRITVGKPAENTEMVRVLGNVLEEEKVRS